ncbi:hypothetical protein ACTWQL_07700 [Pseudalkalibacillus sp. R45]|uniref:hypothetical protein n=1 Tax=Pseudalkalibacillus sp. R45 TaxID=3457433 RepID=UPI003FCCC4F8
MPCEEIIQVVGTLIPQGSRTLLSNQLAHGEFLKMTQKQQSFRKEPKCKRKSTPGYCRGCLVEGNYLLRCCCCC